MDQLIEIWQSLHTEERMDKKYKPEDLIPQVVKLEKNQKKVLLFKTYGSMVILSMLLIIFLSQFTLELNGIIGIGIITTSILGTVIIINKLRFKISDEERSLSTRRLIEVIENKIKIERKLFAVFLPLILLLIILGINLMYFEYLTGLETRTRIFYHLMLTISMVIAFLLGVSVRIKRFRKRFLPLLQRIQNFNYEVNN